MKNILLTLLIFLYSTICNAEVPPPPKPLEPRDMSKMPKKNKLSVKTYNDLPEINTVLIGRYEGSDELFIKELSHMGSVPIEKITVCNILKSEYPLKEKLHLGAIKKNWNVDYRLNVGDVSNRINIKEGDLVLIFVKIESEPYSFYKKTSRINNIAANNIIPLPESFNYFKKQGACNDN